MLFIITVRNAKQCRLSKWQDIEWYGHHCIIEVNNNNRLCILVRPPTALYSPLLLLLFLNLVPSTEFTGVSILDIWDELFFFFRPLPPLLTLSSLVQPLLKVPLSYRCQVADLSCPEKVDVCTFSVSSWESRSFMIAFLISTPSQHNLLVVVNLLLWNIRYNTRWIPYTVCNLGH